MKDQNNSYLGDVGYTIWARGKQMDSEHEPRAKVHAKHFLGKFWHKVGLTLNV